MCCTSAKGGVSGGVGKCHASKDYVVAHYETGVLNFDRAKSAARVSASL